MAKLVLITNGRLGNNLFQLSLVNNIKAHFPSLDILYPHFPELNIPESIGYSEELNRVPDLSLTGQLIGFSGINQVIESNSDALIHCDAWGMNPEIYSSSREYLRNLFSKPEVIKEAKEVVTFHVRGGDLWQNPPYSRRKFIHPDYSAIPISFYRNVMEITRMPAEFVIEKSVPNWYLRLLQKTLQVDLKKSKATPVHDFLQIASSKDVGLGVSTFSWMAAFIGRPSRVHMPILGIFNSEKRPDINLRFKDWNLIEYHFEPHVWTGNRLDREWLSYSECHPIV